MLPYLSDRMPVCGNVAIDPVNWPQEIESSADGSAMTIVVTSPRTEDRFIQTITLGADGTPTGVSDWQPWQPAG